MTLAHELDVRGQLGEIGGPAYISHLSNAVPSAITLKATGAVSPKLPTAVPCGTDQRREQH